MLHLTPVKSYYTSIVCCGTLLWVVISHSQIRIRGHCFLIGGTMEFLVAGVPSQILPFTGRNCPQPRLDWLTGHVSQVQISRPPVADGVAVGLGVSLWHIINSSPWSFVGFSFAHMALHRLHPKSLYVLCTIVSFNNSHLRYVVTRILIYNNRLTLCIVLLVSRRSIWHSLEVTFLAIY